MGHSLGALDDERPRKTKGPDAAEPFQPRSVEAQASSIGEERGKKSAGRSPRSAVSSDFSIASGARRRSGCASVVIMVSCTADRVALL